MNTGRYVWIWLPGQSHPTLCGHLQWDGRAASFAYVRSYHERPEAIPVTPHWPLSTALGDRCFPAEDDALPGFIDDVAPGRWGEYLLEKLNGRRLSAFDALLAGQEHRCGALEFSEGHERAPASAGDQVALAVLAEAINHLDQGRPVDPEILLVFRHGPSLGGRRPKATVWHEGRLWVAKFVSVRDPDSLQPRREAFGLALARRAGVVVPDFCLIELQDKPVLLVERFDREGDGQRRHLISARTLQGLSERQALSVASYPAVADLLRRQARDDGAAIQWFERMVFNLALGNTDDHVLNHLFGWDGQHLSLLPAFDLEQQPDIGALRSQEMIVGLEGKRATFANALSACLRFGLRPATARERLHALLDRCRQHCEAAFDEAGLDGADAEAMRQTLMLDADAHPKGRQQGR